MNSFSNQLAFWFRASNSKLIQPQSLIELKIRKVIFWLSLILFKRWTSTKQASNLKLIDNVDQNIVMRVDISKTMGAAFFWMGYHEFNEWRYLHRFLKQDMVFIDVGSNQGEYALFAAKRLTNGKVVAFEPVDKFYQQLCDNVSLNKLKNIQTLNCGLAASSGSLPIYMTGEANAMEHEGLATLYPTTERGHFVQEIQLRVFDELIESLLINRIDMVKIDVEGAELGTLQGMKQSLEKYKPFVLLEMNEITFRAAGYELDTVVDFFKNLNYGIFKIGREGVLQPVSAPSGVNNCVFVPNDR